MATADNALRLLEIVFLLMPVVAIMLQTVINFYSNRDITTTPGKKYGSMFAIVASLVLFLFSSFQILFVMSQNDVSTSLIIASSGSLAALVFAIVAVGVMMFDLPTQESIEEEESDEGYTILTEDDLTEILKRGIDEADIKNQKDTQNDLEESEKE